MKQITPILISWFVLLSAPAFADEIDSACELDYRLMAPGLKMVKKNQIPVARIMQQGKTPTCMACSATAGLENMILAHSGEKIPLSVPYLVVKGAQIKLRQAYEELGKKLPGYAEVRIVDQDFIMRAAKKYGIVPESAWSPKVPIKEWDDKAFNLTFNKEVLAESVVNGKLLPYEEVLAKFERKLLERTGPLPETFQYGGNTYTPQQFAKEKLPEFKAVQIQIAEMKKQNKGKAPFAESGTKILPREEAVELATSQIDQGIPVPIVFSYNGLYRKKEIMRVDGKPKAFSFFKDFRHGMDMIGYERDTNGKVEWIVVQDSRGEEMGKNGLLWIHRTYFEPFLRRFQQILINP